METGIYIRVQVDGSFHSIDIGDPDLPMEDIIHWMSKTDGQLLFYHRLIFTLLGRRKEFEEWMNKGVDGALERYQ